MGRVKPTASQNINLQKIYSTSKGSCHGSLFRCSGQTCAEISTYYLTHKNAPTSIYENDMHQLNFTRENKQQQSLRT